jgi:sulfur-oxidizing protein SoxY
VSHIHRRVFLKGSVAASAVAIAASAGLLKPGRALAAWPKNSFEAKSIEDALKSLYGGSAADDSSAITIKAPIQAENGAVVPIAVSTTLPNPESISIMVKENPSPLIITANLSGAAGYLSARMKMGKTSDVKVFVKSGGKIHMASQNIKVTVGGCGG